MAAPRRDTERQSGTPAWRRQFVASSAVFVAASAVASSAVFDFVASSADCGLRGGVPASVRGSGAIWSAGLVFVAAWRQFVAGDLGSTLLGFYISTFQSLINEFKVEFTQTSPRVKSLDLHPLQPWVLVSLYSGTVQILNFKSKSVEKSFEVATNVPVRSAKFVAQKDWIVTGSDDKMIRVYDFNTEEKLKEFSAHEDFIRQLVVHPTLPCVLSASDDHLIKLWDWEKDWLCTRIFQGHSHYVMQLAINPQNHNNFASVSLDRSIKIWNLDNSNPCATIDDAHTKGVNCVNYYSTSEAKLYLLTGADDHTIKVWNYESLSCHKVLEGHTNNVTAILVHPHLPLILTASEDKTVLVWNADTFNLEKTLDQGLGRVWALEFEKSSNNIVVGCDEGYLTGKILEA